MERNDRGNVSEWNDNHCHDDLETMYNSFIEVLEGCIEECVPKKMLKLSDKKSNPHWMNEEVKAKRTELSRSKKMFKPKGTPNNLEKPKELEESFLLNVRLKVDGQMRHVKK